MNGASGLSGGSSFASMQVQYDGTGGLDSATNNQNLFNIVACNSTTQGIVPTGNVLTPYSSGWTTGPTYSANQAVCAAWMPAGVYESFTSAPNSPFTLQAVQKYGNGTYLAFAGSAPAAITSVTVQWSGPSPYTGPGGPTILASVTLSSTPGSAGGWWVQDSATNQWALAGLTPPSSITNGQYTTAAILINGTPVGSASA